MAYWFVNIHLCSNDFKDVFDLGNGFLRILNFDAHVCNVRIKIMFGIQSNYYGTTGYVIVSLVGIIFRELRNIMINGTLFTSSLYTYICNPRRANWPPSAVLCVSPNLVEGRAS